MVEEEAGAQLNVARLIVTFAGKLNKVFMALMGKCLQASLETLEMKSSTRDSVYFQTKTVRIVCLFHSHMVFFCS